MDNRIEILEFDESDFKDAKVTGNKGARVDRKNISFLRRFGRFVKNSFRPNPERLVKDAEKALKKEKSYDYVNAAYLDALEAVENDTTLQDIEKELLYRRLSLVSAQNDLNHLIEKAKENVYTLNKEDILKLPEIFRALKESSDFDDIELDKKMTSLYYSLSSKLEHITDEDELRTLIEVFNNTIYFDELKKSSLWYKQLCGEDWDKIVSLREKIAESKENNTTYFEEADELLNLYDKYDIFPKEKVELASYTSNYYLDEDDDYELDELQPRSIPLSEDEEEFKNDESESEDSEIKDDTELEPVTISEDSKEMETTVSELEKMMSSFNTLLDNGDVLDTDNILQNRGNEILAKMKKFESLLQQKEEENKERVLKELEQSLKALELKEKDEFTEQKRQELLNEVESLLKNGMIDEDLANEYKTRINAIEITQDEVFDHNSALTKLNYLEGKQIEDPVEYSSECDELLNTISKLKEKDAVHAMVYKYIEGQLVELKNKALKMQVNENENSDKDVKSADDKLEDNNTEGKTKLGDVIDLSASEISKLMNKKQILEDRLDDLIFAGSTSIEVTDLKQQIKKINDEIEFYKNKIEPFKEKIYQKNSEFVGKTQQQIKAIAKYNSDKKRELQSAEAYEGEKKYLEELLNRMLSGEDIDKEYEETKQLLQEAKESLSKEQYDSLNAYIKLIGESKKRFLDFRTKQKESEVRHDAYDQEMQKWNTLLERLNSGENVHSEESDFLKEYGKACTIFENNKQHYTKGQLIVLEELKNKVQDMVWSEEDQKTR